MTRALHRRLASLEAAAIRRVFVTGWTVTRDGELVGFAPSFGRPDPDLAAWLAHPSPGFVFLIARHAEAIDAEDHAALIPADQASAEALELVAPFLETGRAFHQAT